MMTAFNVVRLKAKAEYEEDVIQFHRDIKDTFPGMLRYSFIKTAGERTYCWIGEWDNYDSIVYARPLLVMTLDRMRPMLEDLGTGVGVTDAVSGSVIVETFIVSEPEPVDDIPVKKPKPKKAKTEKSKVVKTKATKSKAVKAKKAK
jgi:hypothetical protein